MTSNITKYFNVCERREWEMMACKGKEGVRRQNA